MAAANSRYRFIQALKSALLRPLCLATTVACSLGAAHACAQQQQPVSQWTITNSDVDVDASKQRQSVSMVINTSREITATENFVQVRVQNPGVLTAMPLAPNRLQISAAATGVTQVDLLGQDDTVHSIEVMVLGDVRELESILRQNFPNANLSVFPIQQGCIVNGIVTSPEHVDQVIQIAELYFPNVINKVSVSGVFTIQLETQIMEVSRTKLRELGVDWAFANGDDVVSQTVSGLITATGTAFAGTGQETFKIGVIENSTSFFTGIRALRRNNLVKVLAEPKLVAVDGRPASFNSGGEIPIVVPAGLGQVAVQFREFGTRLDYVAKVRGNGRIWLEVRPYVSEVDPSRAVTISGVSVPGFRSRYLETGVEMGAGQTLALAGLLQVKDETINIGLPILSDLPYLGALFRSTKHEQNEVELLITVTPNFAGPLDPHEVPCLSPGLATQPPTDKELYMRGYMESPAGNGPYVGEPLLLGPAMGGEVIQNGYQGTQPNGMMDSNAIPQNSYPVQPSSGTFRSGFETIPPPGGMQQPPAGNLQRPASLSVAPHAPRLAQPNSNQTPYRYDAPRSQTASPSGPAYTPSKVVR